jgi:SAM-dependent methyltransferase
MVKAQSGTSLARTQIEALEVAEGFFGSQVLFSLNELGVFDELAVVPRTLQQIASATKANSDALERLLNAGVALKLLGYVDNHYFNGPLVDQVMVSNRPGYFGNWMRLLARWMRAWTNMTESVRTGMPAQDPWLHLGKDPDYTRDFILGMQDYAQLRGGEIIRYLDLENASTVLDLGGGPGTYATMFAERWPNLRVTVFDLPDVVPIAEKNARAAGVEDRVSTLGGDYHKDDIGAGYDAIFISDVLHQENPETCEMILRKAYGALRPGGRVIIQAMFLNEDRMGPRWPVMHSLILLVLYGGGRAYTVGETIGLMEAAGFSNCRHQRMSLLNVNSLIFAEKES